MNLLYGRRSVYDDPTTDVPCVDLKGAEEAARAKVPAFDPKAEHPGYKMTNIIGRNMIVGRPIRNMEGKTSAGIAIVYSMAPQDRPQVCEVVAVSPNTDFEMYPFMRDCANRLRSGKRGVLVSYEFGSGSDIKDALGHPYVRLDLRFAIDWWNPWGEDGNEARSEESA